MLEKELELFRSSMLKVLNEPRNLAKDFIDPPLGDLVDDLAKELNELRAACKRSGPEEIMDEAVDAANMAFLIWVRMHMLDERDLKHTPECEGCPACRLEGELEEAGRRGSDV